MPPRQVRDDSLVEVGFPEKVGRGSGKREGSGDRSPPFSPDQESRRTSREVGRMGESAEPVANSGRWASVEQPEPLTPRPEIGHVLFDFDGTISLIRQGWPEVMVPMFVEAIPRGPDEPEAELERMVL